MEPNTQQSILQFIEIENRIKNTNLNEKLDNLIHATDQ